MPAPPGSPGQLGRWYAALWVPAVTLHWERLWVWPVVLGAMLFLWGIGRVFDWVCDRWGVEAGLDFLAALGVIAFTTTLLVTP